MLYCFNDNINKARFYRIILFLHRTPLRLLATLASTSPFRGDKERSAAILTFSETCNVYCYPNFKQDSNVLLLS